MTWWKGLIAAAIVLGVGALAFSALKETKIPPVDVQTVEAKEAPIRRTVVGAGKVQAATTVKISSSLSGDLLERPVRQGDVVKKGQVLGRIDKRRYEAAVRQSQSAYNASRSQVATVQVEVNRFDAELTRVKQLVEKGLASNAELEKAVAEVEAAKSRLAAERDRSAQAAAQLEEQANNLSKTTLLAPIDATVIECTREVGERVRGSDFSEDIVMTLAALATMEVKIEVGEHEVVHLKAGQKSQVRIDALEGQSFEGTVTDIAQKALIRNPGTEQETTSFPVTVALTTRPALVLPGMSAEVRITADERQKALVVPVQAVTVRPTKSLPDEAPNPESKIVAPRSDEPFTKVVFVIDGENKVHPRRIKTGISSDVETEVLEGLAAQEKLVQGPYRTLSKDLKDGDEVAFGQGKDGFPQGASAKGNR
jgi:HlyD family secretion protein